MKLARAAAYPVQVPSADWSDEQLRTAWAGSAVPDAVERLEAELGRFLKLDVIATGSARTALYLVLRAVAESMGRVLVPAFTCVAVPNACVAAGVPVRWLDVDGVHMDFALAAGDLRPTDTLLEQHTFGITPPRGHGWAAAFVIEDRAHRFDGADIEGQAAVFSLEHSKVYSAGHGGLLWVRDPVLRARIRRERDALPLPSSAEARRVLRTSAAQRALATGGVHRGVRSIARRVAFRVPGLSMPAQSGDELAGLGIRPTRLHPMYATVALQGIHDAGRRIGQRHRLAEIYAKELGSLVPEAARDGSPVVRMPVLVEDAAIVRRVLRERGLDLGEPWFSAPVHPAGSRSSYPAGSAPRAEALTRSILNLPLHGLITAEEARFMARQVVQVA